MTPKKRVETKKGPNPLIVENGRPSGWDRISYRALNTKSVRVDLIPKISRAFGGPGAAYGSLERSRTEPTLEKVFHDCASAM